MKAIPFLAVPTLLLGLLSACSGGGSEAGTTGGGDYPLDTCVVSGNALDSMGGPVDFEYQGKLVRFCCDGCVATFESSPEGFLAQVYGDDHDAHDGHDHGPGSDHSHD